MNQPRAIAPVPRASMDPGSWLIAAAFVPLGMCSLERFRRFVLAVVLLDLPLNFGVHLGWRPDDADLGALGGLEISITTIGIVLLYLSQFLNRIVDPLSQGLRLRCNRALFFYVALVFLSVLQARDTQLALFEVGLLTQLLLIYIYVSTFTKTRDDVIFVMRWLIIGLLIESVLIIGLVMSGTGFELPGLRARVDVDPGGTLTRVGGTVGSPNGAGSYLAVVLPLAISFAVAPVKRKLRLLAAVSVCASMLALLLTFSRGSWTAFLVSMLFLLVTRWPLSRITLIVTIVAMLLGVFTVLSFQNPISTRLLGDDKGAAQSRIPLIHLAIRVIESNPLTGVGANNFTVAMPDYMGRDMSGEWALAVHNKYLLIWAEDGIFALAAYICFIVSAMRMSWRRRHAGNPTMTWLVFGMLSGVIAYSINMSSVVSRGRTDFEILVILAALISAIDTMSFDYGIPAANSPEHG